MSIRFFPVLLFIASIAHAQQEYVFKNGLAVSACHRYGRDAIVTDLLAYQLYTGQLKPPAENQKLTTDDQGNDIVWKKIEIDTTRNRQWQNMVRPGAVGSRS